MCGCLHTFGKFTFAYSSFAMFQAYFLMDSYAIDQHKVVHNYKVEGHVVFQSFLQKKKIEKCGVHLYSVILTLISFN